MLRIVVVFGWLCAAIAASAEPVSLPPVSRIEIRPSYVVLLELPGAYKSIFVGDAEIADIMARTDRTIAVQGRKAGSTNIIALDEREKPIFSAVVVVGGGSELGRMQIHNRKDNINAYTAYQCSATGCRRIEDPLAEPLPDRTLPNRNNQTTITVTPPAAPPQAR